MYLTFRVNDLPAGALDTEQSRKTVMLHALRKYYLANTKRELTDEIIRNECKVIRNEIQETFESLAELSLYHQDLPVVRLYKRKAGYELKVLDPASPMIDCLLAVMCDEVGRNAVPADSTTKTR